MIKYLIKVILRQRSLFLLLGLGRLYGYFSQDCDLAFNPTRLVQEQRGDSRIHFLCCTGDCDKGMRER